MGNTDQVLRFAVGAPSEPRSGVYRIWAPAAASGKSDMYVVPRRLGQEFKISLHAAQGDLPPRGHLAVSKSLQGEVGIRNRFLQVWDRDERGAGILGPEFQIILPTSELHLEPEGEDTFDGVRWLRPAAADGAVQISVMCGLSAQLELWLLQNRDCEVCARFELANGQSCIVAAIWWSSIDPSCRAHMTRAVGGLRIRQPTFVLGQPTFSDPSTRATIGGASPGMPVTWIEVNVGHAPSTVNSRFDG